MKLPLYLVTLSLFVITAAVNLQVPLYPTYAAVAHVGKTVTATAFSAYILGLIPILILLGGISDRLGRKPVLLTAITFAFLATLSVALKPTMQMLFAARICQGIAVALCMGTCTAYLLELYPERWEVVPALVAFSSALGFGSGALFTSITLIYSPSLAPPSYWMVLAVIGVTFVAALVFVPSVPRHRAGLLRLPLLPSEAMLPNLSIAVAWSVSGLVIAIVPSQLRIHGLQLWSGPALFLVNVVGALAQPFAQRLKSQQALRIGYILVPIGYSLMVLGAWLGNTLLVLVGAGLAGAACYGFTYLGGLKEVVMLSKKEKARGVAGYFLFAYLGFCLPSIVVGLLADWLGLIRVLAWFSLVLIAFSVLAFIYSQSRPAARRWAVPGN